MAIDTFEEGKKDLLQYRIFDNDSDEDVFEGLGNTTLAAGCSSSDDGDSEACIDNKQKEVNKAGGDKVDKKIIEIAV